MSAHVRKAPSRCPHCGFVQQEPPQLISTYCRGCGSYYEVKGQARADNPDALPLIKAARAGAGRATQKVHCYRCDQDHEVSPHARSTMCPGCSASIEMGDLSCASNVSRPVDIRGRLMIEPTGYLNSSFIVCGDAFIEGKVNGSVRCERTLHLYSSGVFPCRIQAHTVVIEKGAEVEITARLEAINLHVYGKATGTFTCKGVVHVHKHGRLGGKVKAKSIIVDKGGFFQAESNVRAQLPPSPSVEESKVPKFETGGFGASWHHTTRPAKPA